MNNFYHRNPVLPRRKLCVICNKEFFNIGTVCKKTCSNECKKIQEKKKYIRYAKNHPERIKETQEKHRNSDKRKSYIEKYKKENKNVMNQKAVQKRKENPSIRLYAVLRTTLNNRIGLKKGRTSQFCFYSTIELKQHLESLFQEGMSWINYGKNGWHIDHVKPLASFNFFDVNGNINHKEIKKAMSLENLQPLWAVDNLSKGAKI